MQLLQPVLCLLLVLFFVTSDLFALSDGYKRCLKRELTFIIAKHPRYAWGGASDLERGLDCSGYLFLAAKWAAIPGVKRTTAYRMSLGLDGWAGREVLPGEADECDLPFWTWRTNPVRVNGHVGAFLKDRGQLKVTHASTRNGVVLVPWQGVFRRDLSVVRRLTIGD